MYQESTYGKTPARLTGQASDVPGRRESVGKIAAVYLLRGDVIISLSPAELDAERS